MSFPTEPDPSAPRAPLPPRVVPVYAPPPYPSSGGATAGRIVLALLLVASIGLNVFLICGGYFLGRLGTSEPGGALLHERFLSGSQTAMDKIAVVRIEGTILEGQIGYALKQIEQAADDPAVKAVVVRIDSPGGSISASDDLHQQLTYLRDGTTPKAKEKSPAKKPLVVSMAGIAASGGYYIAMPAIDSADPTLKKLFAERTTITGSIGVYAAFINAEELTKKYGVGMDLIKAGAVKGSGSLFLRMTPQERQPWADMVDRAYQQFISIVEAGRPSLKDKLTEDLFPPKSIPVRDERSNPVKDNTGQPATVMFTRQRADGGVFTADDALKWGLVDAIGTLDDAVTEVARQARLSGYRAITYDKPLSLLGLLTGSQAKADVGKLTSALGPRLWYLAPGAETNVLVQSLGRD